MRWEITPPASILLLTSVILAVTTWLIWRRRTALGGRALFWMMSAALTWTFTGAMEAASIGLDQKLLWSKLSYLGIAPAAPLFLVFSLVFARRSNWMTTRNMVALWIIPFITLALAATNEYHRLIWSKTVIDPVLNLIVYQHGPAFWLYTTFAYLCIALADVVLIQAYGRASALYKIQIRTIVIGSLFPWTGSIIYLFGFDPIPGLDTTIVFFAGTGILVASGLTQSRLLNLLPIAHDILLQHMQDGVIVMDTEDRVVETNPSAAFLLDKLALPLGGDIQETFKQWPPLAAILAEKPKLPAEIFLPGSMPRYLDVRITTITDLQGHMKDGYLAVLRDITDRRQAQAAMEAKSRELEQISITDELTNLYNRRQADKFLVQEFQLCERYGHPLSVALLDIDDFKQINDGFGHPAGDEAVRSVANILRANIRSTDLAARIGGDEFLLVMPHTDVEKAWPVIERIRTTIQDEFRAARQVRISISAGITGWFPGDVPDEALKRVDRLLYQAKEQGKNRIIQDS